MVFSVHYRKESLKVQKGEHNRYPTCRTFQSKAHYCIKRATSPSSIFLLGSFKKNPIFCNWAKFLAAASSFQLAQNLDLCQNESTCVMQPFWLLKSWLGECILAKQKMKNGKRKLKINLRQNGCTCVMQPFWLLQSWLGECILAKQKMKNGKRKLKIDLRQNESTCVMQPFWLLQSWLGECNHFNFYIYHYHF